MRNCRNLCKSACTKSQQLPIGMDFFNNEYYFIRHLMELIGLWPYEKSVVRVVCVSFFLIQDVLLQLTTFITHECNMSLFIEVFSFDILCMIYVLKYNVIYFNSHHMKNLLDQMQCDWNLIKNVDEMKIIQKYVYKARFYMIFTGLIIYPATFVFILIMFLSDFLDIIAPLDEPRPRQLLIQIECFFDQERYFFFISFISIITSFLGVTILLATENIFMIFLQHACALFEFISYRLTRAFDTYLLKTEHTKTKCRLYTKLLSAFNTHQHCLEFIENYN